jgi:hypothetical protein
MFDHSSEAKKGGQTGEHIGYYFGGNAGRELGFPLLPIQTLQVIRKHDTRNCQTFRQRYLERIALHTAGDGAHQGQVGFLIVGGG